MFLQHHLIRYKTELLLEAIVLSTLPAACEPQRQSKSSLYHCFLFYIQMSESKYFFLLLEALFSEAPREVM